MNDSQKYNELVRIGDEVIIIVVVIIVEDQLAAGLEVTLRSGNACKNGAPKKESQALFQDSVGETRAAS